MRLFINIEGESYVSCRIGRYRVIVATGSAARRMMENDEMPVDAAIVGIIDENYDEVKRQNGEIQRFS